VVRVADSAELSTGTDETGQDPAHDPRHPPHESDHSAGLDELGTDERGPGTAELAAVPVVERQVARAGRAAEDDHRREPEPLPEQDWEFGRNVGEQRGVGAGPGDGRRTGDPVATPAREQDESTGADPGGADGSAAHEGSVRVAHDGAVRSAGDEDPRRHPGARHYTRSALLSTLLDALAAAGKPCEPIDSDDLSAVDELHTGGRAATVELADLLAPPPGAHVLDLGCGLGGPARYLARHRGCRVTGIDLTREYVDLATELTERCGLAELADFSEAEVTDLPFADGTFDAAVLVHVGMNVPDKARLCAEAYRVLRPGGRFAVYDVMRTGEDGELTFPLPWASNPQISFLESPAEYRWQLTEAGFAVEEGQDMRDLAGEQLRRLIERAADPSVLGPHVVLGESYRAKVANLADAVRRDLVTPMQLVATK
jgi:ubiquinone/menaquinone biosynthesis C-methylase UbiE